MAEALRCKVVIPIHYDVWTNFKADTNEIDVLYEMKKDRLGYEFHPFIWDVGGKYVYPQDQDKRAYHYRRGFKAASKRRRISRSVHCFNKKAAKTKDSKKKRKYAKRICHDRTL